MIFSICSTAEQSGITFPLAFKMENLAVELFVNKQEKKYDLFGAVCRNKNNEHYSYY